MRKRSRGVAHYNPRRFYSPVKTIRYYCDEHRKLFDACRSSSCESEDQRYEFSENESLVNSLESSSSCRRSVYDRRDDISIVKSPTTSCLKNVTSKKKTKSEKLRVNFADDKEDNHVPELSSYHKTLGRSATAVVRGPYTTNNTSGMFNEVPLQSSKRTITGYESNSEIMQSTASGLERLSLSSSCSQQQPPRIVKPKDVLKRAATRKMMIYPADGQQGTPLTLNKKWSKIECRVTGDQDNGFRYKVYYLQTFESDKWLPNNKTNSPFRSVDDVDASTDCAN